MDFCKRLYGQSKDSVSADSTEIGLNVSYQAFNNLSFAVQGLYRRAGANTGDAGEVTLDFGFVDLNLLNLSDGRIGARLSHKKYIDICDKISLF